MAEHAAQTTREARSARQATLAAALVFVFLECSFATTARILGNPLAWMYFAHGLFCALLALLLWLRPTASKWSSLVVFSLMALPAMPMLRVAESAAAHGETFVFLGRRIVVIGIAALTPGAGVGVVLLVTFMIEWILFWRFGVATDVTKGEPWRTLIFFGSAFLIVWLQDRKLRLERRLSETELKMDALHEMMRIAMAVRDLMGTPLQSLELGLTLLRARHPEERATLERMRRSLQRLIDLRPVGGPEDVERVRTLREIGARLEALEALAATSGVGQEQRARGRIART